MRQQGLLLHQSSPLSLSWAFHPLRRIMLPGDPFFEEGDIQCNILRKQINLGDDLNQLLESSSPAFKCSIAGCNECFVDIVRFETHYKSYHWHRCRYCKKSFPSNYLLDIHILENHDTLFQMIARKKNMYNCLVESCPDRFSSEEERKDHLVLVHQYPADFRFNKPSRSQRKKLNRKDKLSDPTKTTHEAMDVSGQTEAERTEATLSSGSRRRMPIAICFGRGSARAFQRGRGSRGGRGKRKPGSGKNKQTTTEPATVLEVSMEETS